MTIERLALFAIILVVAACGDTAESTPESTQSQTIDGWTVDLTPTTGELETGEEVFLIELTEDAEPVVPASLDVDAWMPMHGHGTMKPTEVETIDQGVYEAVVTFSMPGDWQVRIDADERPFVFDVEVHP